MSHGRKTAAGVLVFRTRDGRPELFLAHPGDPHSTNRRFGIWTAPKGAPQVAESLQVCAVREFFEETTFELAGPFFPLGHAPLRRKILWMWACEADLDPRAARSTKARKRLSGTWIEYPENDRFSWFSIGESRKRIHSGQKVFIDRLLLRLATPVK
jgi:predicted NUDIX family NTP pyrophosphohydrolase